MKNLNRIQGVVLGTVASWPDEGSVAMIGKQNFETFLGPCFLLQFPFLLQTVFCCQFASPAEFGQLVDSIFHRSTECSWWNEALILGSNGDVADFLLTSMSHFFIVSQGTF